MSRFLCSIARGIGQVMFQDNALSGVLMLVGILLNSWQMALLAIFGNVTGILTASLFGYRREDVENGWYGFNGTLVGLAVGTFMPVNACSLSLLVVFSCLSVWISRLWSLQKLLPGFTTPFILSVWLLLVLCRCFFPSLLLPAEAEIPTGSVMYIRVLCLNVGQVMFQGGSMWTGLFFLAGIFLHSRVHGVYALLGAFLPIPVSLLLGVAPSAVDSGLMGYNSVLCAMALGDKTIKGAVCAILSIVLSVFLQIGGMEVGITTLTAPFVLSVWIVLGIRCFLLSSDK